MPMHTRRWVALIASVVACASFADDSPESGITHPAAEAQRPVLYFLTLRGGVVRTSLHGKHPTAMVSNETAGVGPDGIAIDAAAGHLYWTTMGKVSADDGSIMRSDLDGKNVKTIVVPGGTFTPKQLKLDTQNRKLYWTQKGGDNAGRGTIKRANLELPAGATAATRKDIEVLFSDLPEPIDLDIDFDTRLLYWTDRGDNTISRAPLDPPAKYDPAARTDREIVMRNVGEAIGIALDTRRDRLYYTSLGGVLGAATLNGRHPRLLLTNQGALTGIALLDE